MSELKPRRQRDAADYVNDNLARGLKVLKALEGANFEPVTIQRVVARTGFTYDFCRRALLTLKIEGLAAQTTNGRWMFGTKFLTLSDKFSDFCLEAMKTEKPQM